ncbi:MAG: hypothetical protein OXF68_02285 [Gammaproteobacteria bacterium]|nr:hypothetical protein [Gammaproteobacteria bacterium]
MGDVTNLRGKDQTGSNGGNGRSGDIRKRLAKLEANLGHAATKADLQKMENTLIKWMLGTIVVSALALIVAVIRTLN